MGRGVAGPGRQRDSTRLQWQHWRGDLQTSGANESRRKERVFVGQPSRASAHPLAYLLCIFRSSVSYTSNNSTIAIAQTNETSHGSKRTSPNEVPVPLYHRTKAQSIGRPRTMWQDPSRYRVLRSSQVQRRNQLATPSQCLRPTDQNWDPVSIMCTSLAPHSRAERVRSRYQTEGSTWELSYFFLLQILAFQ